MPLSDIVDQFVQGTQTSVGWAGIALFPGFLLYTLARAILGGRLCRPSANEIRILGVFVALCGAMVWWVSVSGAIYRYLFPFILVSLVVVAPHSVAGLRRLSLPARRSLILVALCPLLITIALLFADHPPAAMERFAGVNLSTGQFREEVALGFHIFDQADRMQRRLTVYSTCYDPIPGVVQATGIYRSFQAPASKGFDLITPMDWRLGVLIRRASFMEGDDILFRPATDAAKRKAILAQTDIRDFLEEQAVIEAWLTGATANDGVEPIKGGNLMKLLRVVDRGKFREAYDALVAKHHWREIFLSSNQAPHRD